ncbi:hypothetical protein DQM09_08110 [Leuconostoc mesenteroides subsp. mesenteroides]|uniref:DUF3102 domain-containing protein n=1 Tax=Leuconostoc mesenteroides TaxID=1245 RepID=UPI000E09792D|nr:DUF3102 domain-containing protein [Leuconostoc mesenteroides]RDF90865.1 hypothetical protein DQM09_08110 [Leuconostoc mesenteroides subsp. mesenteroides]
MNQIENLSNNLTQLTTEIKTYQNIGGQAIFEIGRRLKWVKEHDLAHGEFGKWLEEVSIDRTVAFRFMKIATELDSNVATGQHLGVKALYEIATMPEEEREKPQQLSSGEVKKPDEMTVRELREVKAQLKERDEQISSKDKTIESLLNRQPEVIEKEVEVEKIPDDYDFLKGKVETTESINERYASENAELREALKKRQEAMKNMTFDAEPMQNEARELEQQIASLHQVKSLDERVNSFISDIAVYGKTTDFNGIAIKQETMDHVISSLSIAKKMIEDIEKNITSDKIINADGLD